MNNKQYVGKRVSSFEAYEPESPVTGVRLFVDDDSEYDAGDMSGNVWEIQCPYGTQQMADDLLRKLSGHIYKGFEAADAILAPSAELGDGVTVNGLYSVLASRKVEFGPGHMSDIAAPGDNEPEEEYKYVPAEKRQEQRQLARVRSSITKTAEQIREEVRDEVSGLSSSFTTQLDSLTGRVNGLNGEFGEFKLTVEGFTVTGPDGTTRIKGSSIETESIAAGSIRADQVQLTGSISWGDLDSSAQGQVTAAQNAAATASQNASAALGAAATAQNAVNSVVTYDYAGRTYIDGNKIMTGTVRASILEGGIISLLAGNGYSVGSMTLTQGSAASGGYAVELNSTGGLRLSASGQFWVDSVDGSFGMVGSGFQIGNNCVPGSQTGQYSLGTSVYRWGAVYANTGQIVTSDANHKHDIEQLPDKYVDMLDRVEIVRYKLDDGTSDRYHTGFVAQQVQQAMADAGVDSQEFGGFIIGQDEEGQDVYMLRYEEFIAPLLAKVRQLEDRIKRLEAAA